MVRTGVEVRAKAFRSNSGGTSASCANATRNCRTSISTLTKYGQNWIRFFKWIKKAQNYEHLIEGLQYDPNTCTFQEIFKLIHLKKLDTSVIDGYLATLQQPIEKVSRRAGQLPTFSVPNMFWCQPKLQATR